MDEYVWHCIACGSDVRDSGDLGRLIESRELGPIRVCGVCLFDSETRHPGSWSAQQIEDAHLQAWEAELDDPLT